MDNNTLFLLLVIVLAIVIVAGFFLFRGRSKASIQAGPVKMNFEGASQTAGTESAKTTAPTRPAAADVQVTNAKSSSGGAYVTDDAGGSIRVDQVEVKDDIIVSRSDKTGDKDTSPKA